MQLPGYIKDYLQTTYYVSDEDLALPLDQMPGHVREIIEKKCFANDFQKDDPGLTPVDPNNPDGPKYNSEEQILLNAAFQINEDLNSDDRTWSTGQAIEFEKHHEEIMRLVSEYKETEKQPDDFDKVAILLAAKRMAANDYKDKPKNLETFKQAKDEVKLELQVKYWTTQYFSAKPATNDPDYQEKTVADIAKIAELVQKKQTDKIVEKFDLPQTKEALENAKGATLSVAMMEVRTFAEEVKSRVKESTYYKQAEALNESFKAKYPKTYIAAKIVGGIGAAVALGPVYSAARAAMGINTLRKDFIKYKEENPDVKGNLWSFLKTKKNRQQLMGVGRNMIRIIPGMKEIGIALSAVKNSDMLRNSIQELKSTDKKSKAWMKVGGAAFGLLAVSATAAYLNDDVADSVNDFVSNLMHSQDQVNNAVEQIAEQSQGLAAAAEGLKTQEVLADTLQNNPALAQAFKANPDLVDTLSTKPALVDALATQPAVADTVAANPDLVNTFSANPVQTGIVPSSVADNANGLEETQIIAGQEAPIHDQEPAVYTEAAQPNTASADQPEINPAQGVQENTAAPASTPETPGQTTENQAPGQESGNAPAAAEQTADNQAPGQESGNAPAAAGQTADNQAPDTAPAVVNAPETDLEAYKVGNMSVTENANGSKTLTFGREDTSTLNYKFQQDGDTLQFVQGPQQFSSAFLDAEDAKLYKQIAESEKQRLLDAGSNYSAASMNANFNAQQAFISKKIADAVKADYAENPSPELKAQYDLMAKTAKMRGLKLDDINDNKEAFVKTDVQKIVSEQTAQASVSSAAQPETTVEAPASAASQVSENTAGKTTSASSVVQEAAETEAPIQTSSGVLKVHESGMRSVKSDSGSLFYKFQENSNGEMMMNATTSSRLSAEEIVMQDKLRDLAEKSGMSSGDAISAASKTMLDIKVTECLKAEYAANPSPEIQAQMDYMDNRLESNTLLQNRENGLIGKQALAQNPHGGDLLGEQAPGKPTGGLVGNNSAETQNEQDIGQEADQEGVSKKKTVTVENIRFDTEAKGGGIVLSDGTDNGTTVSTNTTRNGGTSISRDSNTSHSTVMIGKDGNIDIRTNTNRPFGDGDPNNPGTRVENVKIDTENKSGRVVISDGKDTGNKVIVRGGTSGGKVEFETRGGRTDVSIDKNGKINIGGNLNKKAINNIVGKIFGKGR